MPAPGKTINALLLSGNATVSGGPLTIASDLVVNDSGSNTIASDLVFGDEALFLVEGGASLTASGAVSTTPWPAGEVRKERKGTLRLSGNNTALDAAVTVGEGVLEVAHAAALGTTGTPAPR